jgi:hypothetical protein
MGQQLSRLSDTITTQLVAALDASPGYRVELLALLQKYTADKSLSEAQVLQWSAEKLVADATNQQHELGARFLPALASHDLGNFDATTVTQCIAQAAMQYLEGTTSKLTSTGPHHIRPFSHPGSCLLP